MEDIRRVIEQIIRDNLPKNIEHRSKSEIIEMLFVYHEELKYQNEELRRINGELESALKATEELFQEAPVGYLVLNTAGMIIKFNSTAVKILEKKELRGEKLSSLFRDEDQDSIYFFFRELQKSEKTVSCEAMLRNTNFEKHIMLLSNKKTEARDDEEIRIALLDQSKEVFYRNRIEDLTYFDQLTGVRNRRGFEEKLEEFNAEDSLPLGIIYADLDGLKIINDALGHAKGDEALRKAVLLLEQFLPESAVLSRVGGDEFVILLPRIEEVELRRILQRIEKISETTLIEGIPLSLSMGFALKNSKESELNHSIKLAEDVMYKSKLFKKIERQRGFVDSLIGVLFEKHPDEKEHSLAVAKYAEELGRALALDEAGILNLKTAALLHDIGKISIDYSLLEKLEPLTTEDYDKVKTHSEFGYRILSSSRELSDIADIVLHHHEKWDGGGYPGDLREEEIPLASRIITVCDAYVAMLSERPYRRAKTKEEAIAELNKNRNTQFDSNLVTIFLARVI